MSELKKLLDELKSVSENPKKQLQDNLLCGRKVVGCMPVYCPEELVYAAGMLPFGVWGSDKTEINEAKRYFPAFICSVAQTALELGLRGEFNGLSAMMIPVLCDSLKCLGQNFAAGVPQVEFIPVIHPQNRKIQAGRDFLYSQYSKVYARLCAISGTPESKDALAGAVKLMNAHRAAMRAFDKAASEHPATVTPSVRSAVIKSGFFMDKAEHTRIVSRITELLNSSAPGKFAGKRVVVTGILADSPSILAELEKNGLAVVGDDVAAESRQFRTDVPVTDDPMLGLAEQISIMEGCSVLYDPEKKRGGMIASLAKERKADGIVVLMTKFCDPEEFDYPFLKADFDAAGLPSVVVEVDRQMRNYAQAATALQTFAEML